MMIAPYNPSAGALVGKTIVGVLIGVIVSLVIFAITVLFGNTMTQIISGLGQAAQGSSPLLWMIMLVIAFLSGMVGNMLMGFIYGLMYGGIYPSLGKLITYSLVVNVILFVVLAPLYAIVYESVNSLFMVLGFHTIFSVFVTSVVFESSIDAHYSLSSMVGGLIGMSTIVSIFVLVYKIMILNSVDVTGTATNSQIKIMLSLPALLAYSIMPLAHSIWQKIYSTIYDMGSNFLYIQSWGERVVAAQMQEDQSIIEEDINVEMS